MADKLESNDSNAGPNSPPLEAIIVASKKQPPPESAEETRTRSLVILSFWAIVIFLGLPTWWWTTSIPRARLPLQEMLAWADGKVGPSLSLELLEISLISICS